MFIVFEGLDGSGKTTQLKKLESLLIKSNIDCIAHRQPTDTEIGRLVRRALKKELAFAEETMSLLFAADRAEHVNIMLSEIQRGKVILCDRYVFSNMAYQGLSLPMKHVLEINRYAADTLMPDLTFFIDCAPQTCLQRIAQRGKAEIYEQEGVLEVLRDNYMAAFELIPGANVSIINGDRPEDEVFDEIYKIYKTYKKETE